MLPWLLQLLLLTALAALALGLALLLHYRARSHPSIPKHPDWRPVLGVLGPLRANLDRVHDWEVEAHEVMGHRSFQMSVFGSPQLWIAATPSAENIKHMLKDRFEAYHITDQRKRIFQELFGQGIFAADGAHWHRQRKTASLLFTGRELRTRMTQVFADHSRQLLEVLLAEDAQDKPVDLHDLFFRFTMDCFSEIAFSRHSDGLQLAREGRSDEFGRCFDRVQELMARRYFKPWWMLERFLRLPMGEEAELRRELRKLNAAVEGVVKERLRAAGLDRQAERDGLVQLPEVTATGDRATFKTERKEEDDDVDGELRPVPAQQQQTPDLVDHFLRLMRTDTELRSLSPQARTRELRDMVVNFLVAGRDTTACALSWFCYELSRHPAVEARVREELLRVTGAARAGDAGLFGGAYKHVQAPEDTRLGLVSPDFGIVNRLVYLEAVLREVLRLHPSVPFDDKQAVEDDVLPDGTPVPRGSVVTYSPYVAARLEGNWGPDALEFRPERWLSEDGTGLVLHSAYRYPSFNAGPRICLGQSLALLEAKIALCALLQRFDFRLTADAPEVRYRMTVTLQMKDGLWVRASPRPRSPWLPEVVASAAEVRRQKHGSNGGAADDSGKKQARMRAAVRSEQELHRHLDGIADQLDRVMQPAAASASAK